MEVQDLTPVVPDDEKTEQNTKRERWDGEEVDRSNGLAMVSEERQPSLHRIWISRGSQDPSRDTPFRDIETELEQFAVNFGRDGEKKNTTVTLKRSLHKSLHKNEPAYPDKPNGCRLPHV